MTFLPLNHNSNVEKWQRKMSIAEKMKGRSFADSGAGKRDEDCFIKGGSCVISGRVIME